MNFSNDVIVITGASSGIGKSCAELLLSRNAKVIGIDVMSGDIEHENYKHYVLDVRKEEAIKEFLNNYKSSNITGLVNAAGIFSYSKPFYCLSIEEWHNVIETNLTGTFLLSKHISLEMIKNQSGRIVNISCIRSKIYRPNMSDYSASKAGIIALTSTMALDLAEHNIRVNAVAPGFTYTGMTNDEFCNPKIVEHSEKLIPMRHIACPGDIANVVLFLLSDMSNYITGETIFVDGGFTIYK